MIPSQDNRRIDMITFQTQEVVDGLVRGEKLKAETRFVPHEWQAAYHWMRSQMITLCKAPACEDDLLLWGWPVAHEPERDYVLGDEKRPLFRAALALRRTDVLLSDFDAWHSVLAGHRIDAREEEEASISAEASWTRIFDPNALSEDYWGKRAYRIYQACFWQPGPDAIQSIEPLSPPRVP